MFQFCKNILLTFLFFAPASLVWGQDAFPEPESWVSESGTQIRYLYAPELDIVDIQIVFSAGSARDGKKAGVASITNALLAHGSKVLPEEKLNHSMDGLGIHWSVRSLRDMAILTLRSLNDADHLDKAIGHISHILSEPHFPQEGLQRIINSRTVELRALASRASYVLDRAWWQKLYPNHPYASPPYGTIESLASIQRDDLVSFHKKYYVTKNMTIAMVGNISKEKAQAIAKRLTSNLPKGKKAAELPQPEALNAAEEFIEVDAKQAHIRMGTLGVSRYGSLRHYTALYLANYLLGGNGLVSDLSIEVREKRGLAYSVHSSFRPMASRGPFSISLQTRSSKEKESIQVVNDTLSKFVDTIDEERVNEARESILGKFILGLDSNAEMVLYLGLMGFYNLPNSYLNNFIKEIETLDAEFVRETFKRYLANNSLVLVSVGNGI